MKLWSKEALILGGIYGVLDTPFSLLGLEILSDAVFLLFVVGILLLLFNKTPKLLNSIITKYPKTSYYLTAVGWIPYAMIIVGFSTLGGSHFFTYPDTFITAFLQDIAYISYALAVLSLLIAFVRTRKK